MRELQISRSMRMVAPPRRLKAYNYFWTSLKTFENSWKRLKPLITLETVDNGWNGWKRLKTVTFGREGGLTNQRPQTDHVIWGPMRGLEELIKLTSEYFRIKEYKYEWYLWVVLFEYSSIQIFMLIIKRLHCRQNTLIKDPTFLSFFYF